MKRVLQLAIGIVLILNVFLILPSTKSKYVKDDVIEFSASAETPYVEIYKNNSEKPLENGSFGVKLTAEHTGYYGVIAKGSSGSPKSDLTKNEGGIIASYIFLNKGETLYAFLPYYQEYINGKGKLYDRQYINSFGLGMGSNTKVSSKNDNIGGAATVITLNALTGRENILIMAAGSGVGCVVPLGKDFRGGGGGSNINQLEKYSEHRGYSMKKAVQQPVPGTVYGGFQAGNGIKHYHGGGATELGGAVATDPSGLPKSPGTTLFDGGTGAGGWFGGGGGYAGGGGGSAACYSGGGGSSFLSDKAKKMPDALYRKIRDENQTSSGKIIEQEKTGCVMFTFLGTDESKITAFTN